MPKLTEKGMERLRLLEEAERSGKITAKGKEVLGSLRQVSGKIEKPQTETPSIAAQAWDALKIPEKKSREGLQMLAQISSPKKEVTGNLVRDVAANTPRLALETLSEVAPSFVSRGAIATAGLLRGTQAARPALSAIRKGAFKVLEKTSGLAPKNVGVLDEAYRDPTLIFAKGKEAAGKFYEAAGDGTEAAKTLSRPDRLPKIISNAVEKANAGVLTPKEALKARKAVDATVKSGATYSKDDLFPLRKAFDQVAKTDPNIAKGDKIAERGIKASALRNLFPTNIGGTFSSFRTAGAGAVAALIPGGKVIAPILVSPAVQGAGATALGAASKAITPVINNPVASSAGIEIAKMGVRLTEEKAKEFLKKAKGDRNKARKMAKDQGYEIPIVE